MADLQDEGLGDFIRSGNNSAFIKQVPNKVNESENLTPYKMSIGQYTSAFCRKNYDLPNNLRGSLLSKSILDEAITNFFEEEKENQSTWVHLKLIDDIIDDKRLIFIKKLHWSWTLLETN